MEQAMSFSQRRFQGLKWQLTISYARLILLIGGWLFLLVTIGAFTVTNLIMPSLLLYGGNGNAEQATFFFAREGRADPLVLQSWLRTLPGQFTSDPSGYQPASLMVIDSHEALVAALDQSLLTAGSTLRDHFTSQTVADIQRVLSGKSDGIVEDAPHNAMLVITPIKQGNVVYGVLLIDTGPDIRLRENLYWVEQYLFIYLPAYFVGYLLFGGMIGLIGGIGTARKFNLRFSKLARATEKWSQGDFSMPIDDTAKDELGQLAQQLNGMAEQLQLLLRARQKLAALEERNRLARDLHDSIKQQVFAISMQISATKMLLKEKSPELHAGVEVSIEEAERLVRQTQKELTALVQELHPIALEGRNLASALETMLAGWSRQSSIAVDFQASGELELAPHIEEAFYRVAQEALSNILRHSQASRVQVDLQAQDGRATLSICDNGCGFLSAASNGNGIGLLSMRERMQALGGSIEIRSVQMKGTTVLACYPAPTAG
jgi:NarL family two-component system sensor histidine kinase LiaS